MPGLAGLPPLSAVSSARRAGASSPGKTQLKPSLHVGGGLLGANHLPSDFISLRQGRAIVWQPMNDPPPPRGGPADPLLGRVSAGTGVKVTVMENALAG